MPKVLATLCLAVLLVSSCSGALALDPITLTVLRLLRDQVLSSALEKGVTAMTARPAPQPVPGVPTSEQLRRLVDEGFVYLSSAQRSEIHASVEKLLADPQHASARALLIEQFARTAAAARVAHERLSRLSAEEKGEVARRTVREYRQMPPDEAALLLTVLRAGTAPIPRELNELILAGLAEQPVTARTQ